MYQLPENQRLMRNPYNLTVRVLLLEGEKRIIRGGEGVQDIPQRENLFSGFGRKVVMYPAKSLILNDRYITTAKLCVVRVVRPCNYALSSGNYSAAAVTDTLHTARGRNSTGAGPKCGKSMRHTLY